MIDSTERKIVSRKQAASVRYAASVQGKKTVLTNGCFDILHSGHIEYLEKARLLGDLLIIGLNTDASVRRLKGNGRPVVPEEDRARVTAALECVDFVCFFDEDTPKELIDEIRPDILVKGADYAVEEIVGGDRVIADGGSVVTVDLVPGRSTSGIIDRIRKLK